jgi:L-threonylcarbamoyladenylate synthase
MDKINIDSVNAIENAVITFDEEGVVMHPTETCYGLAVDIFHEDALRKLYFMKDMKEDKPLSILVGDMEMAQEYGVFSEKALELAKQHWPGALTIIVPKTENLPAYFNKGHETIAIRISGLEFCRELVQHLGEPITTTSANKAGEAPLYSPMVMGGVDLLVDGGVLEKKAPSTVISVIGDEVKVIRQGELEL